MTYIPPVGNVVDVDLTGAYSPPAGGGVLLDLGEGGGFIYPQIDIGSTWKTVTEMKLNVGGAWKEITEIKTAISGVWKDLV